MIAPGAGKGPLTIVCRDAPVAERDEGKPRAILDYDAADSMNSIDVLDASKRVGNPRTATRRVIA